MHDYTIELHNHLRAAYELVVAHGSGQVIEALHDFASHVLGVDLDKVPEIEDEDRDRILWHIGSGVARVPGGWVPLANAMVLGGWLHRVRVTTSGIPMFALTTKGERKYRAL